MPEASSAPPVFEGSSPVAGGEFAQPEASAPAAGEGPPPAVEGASAPPVEQPPAPVVPTVEPTIDPVFENTRLPGAEDRWRYVQVNRTPLEAIQAYSTPSRQNIWWYDPLFGQPVKLGEVQGEFPVQATFRFRGQEVEALEIPFNVNQSFGITVPPAIVERINRAGYGEWVEAFVYKTDDIRPK